MRCLPFTGASHRSPSLLKLVVTAIIVLHSVSSPAQFFINEIMPANGEVVTDYSTGNHPGWIELYNPDPGFRNLSGYYISDDPDEPRKYRLTAEAAIAGRGYMILWCDGLSRDIHTNFSLARKGEWVILSDPFGAVIDRLPYPDQYIDYSFGRKRDGSPEWGYFEKPTPEASNTGKSFNAVSGKPVFSLQAGVYPTAQNLVLESPSPGAAIRYTRDGNEPNQFSDLYTGPILLNFTQTVKAKLFLAGALPGPTVTNTYIINQRNFTLPLISISTSPGNLWDNNFGIYVEGTNGIPGNCAEARNWNQEWYRHAVIEYFGTDGFRRYRDDADIRIGGACSRTLPQKSLVVRARSKYGSNEFDFNFLPNKPFSKTGGFILRNAGNDFNLTHFRDALQQAAAASALDVDYSDYRPVVVYLNGEYWGIMNIREKPDSDYITSNYGYDPEDIDLIDQSGRALEGSAEGWYSYLGALEQMERSTPEAWQHISYNIDVESYISYLVTEMYLANTDWPGNNQRWWRPRAAGGKWRWVLYDMDFGMALYEGFSNALHPTLTFATNSEGEAWPNPPWSTLHIRLCLENPTFRMKFIRRMNAAMDGPFHPDRLNPLIDAFVDRIAYEMPYHKTRWGGTINDWFIETARLKSFSAIRNQFMRKHLKEFFSLGDSLRFVASVKTPGTGTLEVNGVKTGEQLQGFFNRDLPVEVRAMPAPGQRFREWSVTRGKIENLMLLTEGSEWKYQDKGVAAPAGWTDSGFDDTDWATGPAQLGYGDGDEKTVVSFGGNEAEKFITTYFRKSFTVEDTTGLQAITVNTLFDDGIAVYVNGAEVYRDNLPEGEIGPQTTALEIAAEGAFKTFTLPVSYLQPGENVIAAEVHQVSPSSSDISFELSVSARRLSGTEVIAVTGDVLTDTIKTDLTVVALFEPDDRDLSGLRINEVFSNPGRDASPDSDWIELINIGPDTIDLRGVFVSDDRTNPMKHVFPGGTEMKINPGQRKVLIADARVMRGADHLPFSFSSDGEEAGLYYLSGDQLKVVDEVIMGPLPPDGSLSRIPDGEGPFVVTGISTYGTPNILATGLEELRSVRLVPNPSDGFFTVMAAEQDHACDLIDLHGRVLLRNLPLNQPVDATSLAPGMYLIRLRSAQGMTVLRLLHR